MATKKVRSSEEITDAKNMYILFVVFVLVFSVFIAYFFYKNNEKNEASPKVMSEKLLENKIINNYYKDEDLSLPKELNYKAPAKEATLKIPILMYHYIENVKDPKDTIRIGLSTPPSVLESQIITLLNNGYTPVTQSEIMDILSNKIEMPAKPIALTFDDGYQDFYTVAFPILKKYGVKATIYAIVDFLDYPNYMTKDELKEISDSNLVEVGSHTLNHIYLKTASEQVAKKEIEQSKERLEIYIQKEVKSFAYPYGAFNENTEKMVESAGYQSAVTVVPGSNQSLSNTYFLYRLRPGYRTDNELIKFLDNSK